MQLLLCGEKVIIMEVNNGEQDFSAEVVSDFCRMYQRAGADGRADVLFGAGSMEKAAEAVGKSVLRASEKPGFYLEFPFAGKPRMDLLLQYTCNAIEHPVKFCAGDIFGCQSFFDICAGDSSLEKYICGFSFDLSEGREEPGIYLLPPVKKANADYFPDMLERLGVGDRVPKVMAAVRSMPADWIPYYAGYMANRPDAPVRLGIIIPEECLDRYAEDVGRCEADLGKFYPSPFSGEMREIFSFLVKKNNSLEFQFDMYPDGSFADGLGVTVSSVRTDPRRARGFMSKGELGEIMRYIESLGLADERWKLMDQACCGIRKRVREDHAVRLVGDVVELNAVKIRFRNGNAFLAKGYLLMRTANFGVFPC